MEVGGRNDTAGAAAKKIARALYLSRARLRSKVTLAILDVYSLFLSLFSSFSVELSFTTIYHKCDFSNKIAIVYSSIYLQAGSRFIT